MNSIAVSGDAASSVSGVGFSVCIIMIDPP
jgi:hypothetical protein